MRKIRLLGYLLALCLLLGACARPAQEAATAKPCADVAAAVEAGQAFEEMTLLGETQALKLLQMDEAPLADMAVMMDASRATAEMIVVLTALDADSLAQAQQALEALRDDALEQYRDYRPQEVPKITDAVLETAGLQAALIISKDADAAREALQGAWQ